MATNGGGVGVLSLLGVAFVILRLCGVIGWPWIWVLSPFWVPLAGVLAVALVFAIVLGVVAVVKK